VPRMRANHMRKCRTPFTTEPLGVRATPRLPCSQGVDLQAPDKNRRHNRLVSPSWARWIHRRNSIEASPARAQNVWADEATDSVSAQLPRSDRWIRKQTQASQAMFPAMRLGDLHRLSRGIAHKLPK
jgi:hypothetical protein